MENRTSGWGERVAVAVTVAVAVAVTVAVTLGVDLNRKPTAVSQFARTSYPNLNLDLHLHLHLERELHRTRAVGVVKAE